MTEASPDATLSSMTIFWISLLLFTVKVISFARLYPDGAEISVRV